MITGAYGFIGYSLCKYLSQQNVQVYAVVRKLDKNRVVGLSNVEFIQCDLNDMYDIENVRIHDIDVLYHFAWEGSSGGILGDYEQQIKNITISCHSMELAKRVHAKKFIYAGTINEYELNIHSRKSTKGRRSNIYSASKLAGGLMCETLANCYGMEFIKTVLSNIFGPGDRSKKIHNVFIYSLLNDKKPLLTDGLGLYDWLFIDDAVEILSLVGQHGKSEKIYYIGNRELKRFRDYLVEVRDILKPSFELDFGTRKDDLYIDYDQLDLFAVYNDIGYYKISDFKTNILRTADWLENINFTL